MSNIVPTSNPTNTPAVQQSSLPVKKGEDFIAEAEVMDLTPLKDKLFVVAVSTGDRNKVKLLASTIHGPYNFAEMAEQVGSMWQEHQHHAKVIIIDKDVKVGVKMLDENTVDYIETHYGDIAVEAMLDGVFDDIKDYTCQAGVVDSNPAEDPRNIKAIEEAAKAQEAPEEEL